jgi:hypothetical protein
MVQIVDNRFNVLGRVEGEQQRTSHPASIEDDLKFEIDDDVIICKTEVGIAYTNKA